ESVTEVPILNYTDEIKAITSGQVVLRAEICSNDEIVQNAEVQTVREPRATPLEANDINVPDNLDVNQLEDLLGLINEYRDCFAVNFEELGKLTAPISLAEVE